MSYFNQKFQNVASYLLYQKKKKPSKGTSPIVSTATDVSSQYMPSKQYANSSNASSPTMFVPYPLDGIIKFSELEALDNMFLKKHCVSSTSSSSSS